MGAGASLWLAARATSVFLVDIWGGNWVSAWRSGDNLKKSFLPHGSLKFPSSGFVVNTFNL